MAAVLKLALLMHCSWSTVNAQVVFTGGVHHHHHYHRGTSNMKASQSQPQQQKLFRANVVHSIEDDDEPDFPTKNAQKQYQFYTDDIARYNKEFKPLLPKIVGNESDAVLFLPISYHLNPSNFPALVGKEVCKNSGAQLKWNKDPSVKMPNWDYCGFNGRSCYSDDQTCESRCAQDIEQAFGGESRSTSSIQISPYFTWYSQSANQPVMSGFWTNPFDSNKWPASSSSSISLYNPCAEHSNMCDPTCADTGGLGDNGNGCAGERACGTFATCALGSAKIGQSWAKLRPSGNLSEDACKAGGYRWSTWEGGYCGYDSSVFDCDKGRCYDRGHLVPSGAVGAMFGRSGETFSMCNIGAQTAVLNECKWMYLEQVAECLGRQHKILVLGGAHGPYSHSLRMSEVPKPEYFWKLMYFPDLNKVLFWTMTNDDSGTYVAESYTGRAGLNRLESENGISFDGTAIAAADFPSDCELIHTLSTVDDLSGTCGFRAWDGKETGHKVAAISGPFNLIRTCGNDKVASKEWAPCPA